MLYDFHCSVSCFLRKSFGGAWCDPVMLAPPAPIQGFAVKQYVLMVLKHVQMLQLSTGPAVLIIHNCDLTANLKLWLLAAKVHALLVLALGKAPETAVIHVSATVYNYFIALIIMHSHAFKAWGCCTASVSASSSTYCYWVSSSKGSVWIKSIVIWGFG